MLEISPNAGLLPRTCVAVHNKLHETAFRRRLAVVPIAVAVCLWIGFWWWSTHIRQQFVDRQYIATDVLAAFEAANKSVIVISDDEKIAYTTDAADKTFGRQTHGRDLKKVFPQLAEPVHLALTAAKKRTNGHSLVQFIAAKPDNPAEKLQINVTAATVLDHTTVVVTAVPLCELNAVADHTGAK